MINHLAAKLIVKHFNTSEVQRFYQIKITTTVTLPYEVARSRTVTLFMNSLDKHYEENPLYIRNIVKKARGKMGWVLRVFQSRKRPLKSLVFSL